MSGPKIVDYQAIERQRAEAAQRRWSALRGRAEALRQRCVESGHPECAVSVGSSSDDIESHCDELSVALDAAAEELLRRQFADRTREVISGLDGVLADLERRERAASESAQRETQPAAHRQETRFAPAAAPDYTDRVTRQLSALQESSKSLQAAAAEVLGESDPARARILYNDLKQRVALANEATTTRHQRLTEIAELRAQFDRLTDPEPLHALLDQAADGARRGADVGGLLRQARSAITAQLDAAAAAADRDFVQAAVADALRELGYQVADVAVATPETLVVRQSTTHGVRANIDGGQIDIAAVRLGGTDRVDGSADRDAEDEFCRRVPGLLTALDRRGISTRVREAKLPGLFAPETVATRTKVGPQATTHEHTTTKRQRRSTP